MSMIMTIARGRVDDLERLAAEGDRPAGSAGLRRRVEPWMVALTPERRAQLEQMVRNDPRFRAIAPQLLERLQRSAEPGSIDRDGGAATAPRPETIDIHKSWHVFHYLFTGQAGEGGMPPANFLLEGGRETGEDGGYGPARLFDSAETAAIARFLDTLSSDALVQRIDASRMAALGIYCANDGSRATARELADDVRHYFPLLQTHVRAAAAAGEALLVSLT